MAREELCLQSIGQSAEINIILSLLKTRYPKFAAAYLKNGVIIDGATKIWVADDLQFYYIEVNEKRLDLKPEEPLTFKRMEDLRAFFAVDYTTSARIAVLAATLRECVMEVKRKCLRLRRL